MALLAFEGLWFEDRGGMVRANFLELFYFDFPKDELLRIGKFNLEDTMITFKDAPQMRVERRFSFILQRGFRELKNKLNGKKAIYINMDGQIPLIGNVSFGLIDRDTNVIEIKPITGCNLKCIYCSVDEDRREVDFVVEMEYLIEEFKKLVEFKQSDNIEAHIASQGEPLLYEPLDELIREIAEMKQVKTISIDTNGIMLTKKRVNELVKAGLTRFNFSINALDEKLTKKIAGKNYNIENIKEICRHIVKKANLIITPVLIPNVNEGEMPKIIEFAKEINAEIGIQNCLNYKFGRNAVKQKSFDWFYEKLKKWEKEHDVKLIKSFEDFGIEKTKPLPKPFKKGDIVNAEIFCRGRLKKEKIAVAKERSISIPSCRKEEGRVKLRITRSKHNIFIGSVV